MAKKSLFLTISLIFILIFTSNNFIYAVGYSDIKNHWAKEYIIPLAEKNIISGYPDGTFKPDNNITVAEFTKLVLVSSGIEFENSNPWHKAIISKAMEEGLIKKGEFTNYDKRLIARGEMAGIIARQLGVDSPEASTTSFKDDKQIPKNLKGYIKVASDEGIITGMPNGNFNANGYATRGEAATMIYRMIDAIEAEDIAKGKKPIGDIVKNSDVLYEPNIRYVENVASGKYSFDTYEKDGSKFIVSDAVTCTMVFIKNGEIIRQIFPMPSLDKVYYSIDFDLSSIEYIGIYTLGTNTMEIIENPFK